MAAEMRIKVKTEELVSIAGEAETQMKKVQEKFQAADELVKRSSVYWEAEGQTAYVQAYTRKSGDIERAMKNLVEYADKLRKIAGVYAVTEAAATEMAGTLSEDVIE